MLHKYSLDIATKARKKHPFVASIAKRFLRLLPLLDVQGDAKRKDLKSARAQLLELEKVKNHTVSGDPSFSVDLLPQYLHVPYNPPAYCNPWHDSPILGDKPLVLEPQCDKPAPQLEPEIENDAICDEYSPTLTPQQKLGSSFFFHLDNLCQCHVNMHLCRQKIANLALVMKEVYTQTFYTYKNIPRGRGGVVNPGGFIYKTNILDNPSSPMDILLKEALPEEMLYPHNKAVALLRVMGPNDRISPHIDEKKFGPAIIFLTIQEADPSDLNIGGLKFSDGFSNFVVPSDPSKAFCFYGRLRSDWTHCVEPLPPHSQPRITVTYRLWGNETEPWSPVWEHD